MAIPITPATGTSTPPAQPSSGTVTSNDPIWAEAVAQAQAALQAQEQPLQAQQAASDAYYASRQSDATASASALSQLLQNLNIGGNIQGAYQNAAQDQSIMGQAFAQGQSDALNNSADGINKLLDTIGAPSGQQTGGATAPAATALAGIGGLLPAQNWEKAGAAQASAADVLPGIALLQGQENYKSLGAQGVTAHADFDNQIATLAGNLPGDIQSNYDSLYKIAQTDRAFAQKVAQDKVTNALALKKVNNQAAEFNVTSGQKAQSLQLQAQKAANAQLNANRDYAVKLANLKVSQGRLQQTILKNSFAVANGGLTKAQSNKYSSQALGIAQQGYHGVTKVTSTAGVVSSTPGVGAVSYFEALGNILKKGIPVQIALNALDQAYPAQYRPTPQALANELGPLAPEQIKALMTDQSSSAMPGLGTPQVDTVAAQPLKDYAFSKFKGLGWGPADAQALDQLWNQESGWNASAVNPASGASGIPQELGHTVPANYATNPKVQIDWGLNYIQSRYGNPQAAWAHEQKFGWY